jgi:tetratricopeptide (TPR) repeat protein
MKTRMKNIVILATLLLMIAACTSDRKSGQEAVSSADEMSARIRVLEDSLFENMAFDRRNAQMLLDIYKAYVAAYPLDNRAPEYLFRAASVARAMKEPRQSIALYDRIIADYQGWERLPDAFYLKAFTIDTELRHKGDAKEAYLKVVYNFPEHPFAQEARIMIDNLEYSDEELIQRFKEMEAREEAASTP